MSHYTLPEGRFTAEDLSERLNTQLEESDGDGSAIANIVDALLQMQNITFDDFVKHNIMEALVQAIHDIDEEAHIDIEDGGIIHVQQRKGKPRLKDEALELLDDDEPVILKDEGEFVAIRQSSGLIGTISPEKEKPVREQLENEGFTVKV